MERYNHSDLKETRWFDGRFRDNRLRDALMLAMQIVPRELADQFMVLFAHGGPSVMVMVETSTTQLAISFPGSSFGSLSMRQRVQWAISVVTGVVWKQDPGSAEIQRQRDLWIKDWEADPETSERRRQATDTIARVLRLEAELRTADQELMSAIDPGDVAQRGQRHMDLTRERETILPQLSPERQLWLEEERWVAVARAGS